MKVFLSTAAVHMSTALKYRRGWSKKNVGVEIIEGFNKGKGKKASQRYRLYLPIHAKRPKVKIPQAVTRAVDQAGYIISDYIAGLATQKDGKRVMKIGKLIKDEHVRNAFANDEQRQSHKNEYTCVISCHPYDIIGMSTGRTWDQFSCMRLGAGAKLNPNSNNGDDGAYSDTITHDIAQGTLVAYAVKNSDLDIKSPDARVLIKPYKNDRQDEILFRVETKVYGNHVTGFRETVSAFLRKVNANASAGRYSLIKGLYNDGAGYHARHMGPVAYADLTDPEQLQGWMEAADVGDFSDKFKEENADETLAILEKGTETNLYKDHIFNSVTTDLFEADGISVKDAQDRLNIILPKLIAMGKAGNEMLNSMMNKFFVKFTSNAIPDESRAALHELVRYNPDRNYPFGFLVWAYKLNPAVLLQPNGDINQDLGGYVGVRHDYPFVDSEIMRAVKPENKETSVYQVALLESFVQYAAAKMKGLRSTMGWKPIDPSMAPNESFIKYGITDRLDALSWTDAQKLYAYAANSFDWFNRDNIHLINASYMEHLKVSDLFSNPYVATIYETGVSNDDNSKEIADNFAQIVERVCDADHAGVKAEETRLYELSELLGEHDYNVKRGIEKAIDRALYP